MEMYGKGCGKRLKRERERRGVLTIRLNNTLTTFSSLFLCSSTWTRGFHDGVPGAVDKTYPQSLVGLHASKLQQF